MNKMLKSLLVNPVLLSATLTVSAAIGVAGTASAAEVKADATTPGVAPLDQMRAYGSEGVAANDAGQVTSVSQLSDVRPTDWAFQALQSLVERYGCIAGYPDRTYRGNRALTRYEFAAGLNACLDRVNELIAASTADLVKKEDLATLQKLQEQFAAELATLRGRVDALEARTTTLERQQFSTTTKLRGEAIFAISGAQGDEKAVDSVRQRAINALPTAAQRAAATIAAQSTVPNAFGLSRVGGALALSTPIAGSTARNRDIDSNTTFSDRVRLSLNSSFSGKDTLLVRLQARNITNFGSGNGGATGTPMGRLSFEGSNTADNSIFLDKLFYRLPIGNGGTVTLDAVNGEFYNNVPNFNPLLASDSQGSISRFGRFNPIYRQGSTGGNSGAGLTINYPLGDAITVSAGYLATNANDPSTANGLFNGSYAALGQIAFKPTRAIDLGFTYVRSYNRTGGLVPTSGATGSLLANTPFGGFPTSADQFGISGSLRLTPNFVLAGWGGYTRAHAEGRIGTAGDNVKANAEIWNWAVTFAFPDLGGKGNLAGVIFGQPPKVTRSDVNGARDLDTSYHLEGLYRLQLSDKISITPGIIVIFNPDHNDANGTVYVGTIRTTFTF